MYASSTKIYTSYSVCTQAYVYVWVGFSTPKGTAAAGAAGGRAYPGAAHGSAELRLSGLQAELWARRSARRHGRIKGCESHTITPFQAFLLLVVEGKRPARKCCLKRSLLPPSPPPPQFGKLATSSKLAALGLCSLTTRNKFCGLKSSSRARTMCN